MVNIIAHRGLWRTPEEQNTLVAFARAFDAGFGVELDVRDWDERLVVSHDPPKHPDNWEKPGDAWYDFRDVLSLLAGRDNVLAVNVKSCGLAPWFAQLRTPTNWFFFDLPPYEHAHYATRGLVIRQPYISCELFGHDYTDQWRALKKAGEQGCYLVTDHPEEAREYFR